MSGSSYGKLFSFTTWGESHGKAIGVCIDGCPAGIPLCEEDIQSYLDRRKPGQSRYTTKRAEDDAVEILSGVFEGRTTGTPISLVVLIRTRGPEIIRRSLPITGPVMPTTVLMQNTAFGITGEAAAPPAGRPSAAWRQAL